jgi:dTDP-4-dehydrorhamnose reductase
MNVAITGVRGNLGSVLCKSMRASKFNVYPIPSELYRPEIRLGELVKFLRINNITVIIHCASLTNVDFAEVNKKLAHDSNVVLTQNLAKITANLEIKMVLISSTGIYGNDSFLLNGLNSESDYASPLNVYHATKFQAESVVNSLCDDSLTLRVGWLFGSASLLGKDFVLARVQEMAVLSRNDEYYSNTEQFGNPTSSEFVAEKIGDLLLGDVTGVINCVNDGAVSRYDFVSRIKDACGFDFKLIPKPNSFFSRTALMPLNETGNTSKLASYSKPLHWDDYLVQYCNKLEKDSWRVK